MRPIRAVDPKASLRRFAFYTIVVVALVVVAQLLINKALENHWSSVQARLEQEQVMVSRPHFLLRRFGLPWPGVQFDTASFIKRKNCTSYQIQLKDLYVPLPWKALVLPKEVKFRVFVSQLKAKIEKANHFCENLKAKKKVAEEPTSIEKRAIEILRKDSKEIKGQLSEQMAQIQAIKDLPVEQLIVSELLVDWKPKGDRVFKGKGRVDLKWSDESLLYTVVFPDLAFNKQERSLSARLDVRGEANKDQIQGDAVLKLDEGRLDIKGLVRRQGESLIELTSKQMPLSAVNRWANTSWNFQYLWLNCSLKNQFKGLDWSSSNWKVDGCRIESPKGKISLTNQQLSSLRRPESLGFSLENIDLDHVIKNKNSLPLAGNLEKLGLLNGELEMEDGEWQGQLRLKGGEILFSNKNRLQVQPIDALVIEGGYKKGLYRLSLGQLILDQTELPGYAELTYNSRKQQGQGKLAFEAVPFSKNVQELMVTGQLSPVFVRGQLSLGKAFALASWRGQMGFADYASEFLAAKEARLNTSWTKETGFTIDASLKEMTLEPVESSPLRWVFASLLQPATDKLILTDLKGQAMLKKRTLSWETLTGKLFETNWSFKSQGSYQAKKQGEQYIRQALMNVEWEQPKTSKKYSWEYGWSDIQAGYLKSLSQQLDRWIAEVPQVSQNYDFIQLSEAKEPI